MAQNSSSGHIPNRSEYTCASNDTYKNIHSKISIVSTNWKLPKCLSVDGIRKFVVYSSNGINTMWYGKPRFHLTDKMLSKSKHNDIQHDFIFKKALHRNQISGDRSQNNYTFSDTSGYLWWSTSSGWWLRRCVHFINYQAI